MTNAERVAAMKDLIDQGMYAEEKVYEFDTPVNKILRTIDPTRSKHSITVNSPIPKDQAELELLAIALGIDLFKAARRQVLVEARNAFCNIAAEEKTKREVEMVKKAQEV